MSAAPFIPLSEKKKRLVILGAAVHWFYLLLFAFTMPVALPPILEQYGLMPYYAVINGASSLINILVTLIGGKLGDRLGRRRVVLFAGWLRLALLILCAVPTGGAFFSTVYLLGVAAGGLLNAYPAAILSDVTAPEERPRWFGIFGMVNGAALLIGMLCGGIISDTLGPLNVFLFIAPFGAVSLLLLSAAYPNRAAADKDRADMKGILLLLVSCTGLMAWCSFGGILFGRVSLTGILLLLACAFSAFLLILWEKRAPAPLLNFRLFGDRHFLMSFSLHFLIAPMMCLCSSCLTLYGQKALSLSTTLSGTLALPKNILFFLLPPLLGHWIGKRQDRFRAVFLLCGITIALAGTLCIFFDTHTPLWTVYAVMLLFGVGTSSQSVCVQPYMQLTVSSRDMGTATSMVQFANSLGTILFSAFYNIIFNARYLRASQSGIPGAEGMAVATVFSAASAVTAVSGAVIIALTLLFVVRAEDAAARSRLHHA